MKVRDELSNEVFDAEWVLWVPDYRGLPRDNWSNGDDVKLYGWEAPRGGASAWAQSTDGGEERWLPVEVLS